MFVTGKPFQPSLMFVSKLGALRKSVNYSLEKFHNTSPAADIFCISKEKPFLRSSYEVLRTKATQFDSVRMYLRHLLTVKISLFKILSLS